MPKYRTLDVFSGCGGLSEGFHQAGKLFFSATHEMCYQVHKCLHAWVRALVLFFILKTGVVASFRYLWDSVGHRDVGACSTGLQAQQPWHHSVHWGLQRLAKVGHVWREDKFSWPEAASERWRGDAVWRTSLPRVQWNEPIQLSHLFCIQELPRGLLSQVSVF